ncbi:MAG: T9SS type A sorting domain-containing protein [Cytophagales bacterium]|nr:T9SS type A sorting domain-containing protein [Cytophagales bacterium]
MKKLLLPIAAILAAYSANAQCTELFFSEYVEGSHNNKALEIYNPTSQTIYLGNYRIIRWSNGSTTSDQDIRYVQSLSAADSIPSNGTFVAILDRRDPLGTGFDTILFAELLNFGNTCNAGFYSPCYLCSNGGDRVLPFNGDDAISLEKDTAVNNWIMIDLFGLIGERPQTALGGTGAGWTNAPNYWDGIGAYWTKDQTLIRKYNIGAGVTTNPGIPYGVPGAFNPTIEWDSLPRNTFDSLGFHNCFCSSSIVSSCTVTSIDELTNKNTFIIYPNPSSNNRVTITSGKVLKSTEVYDLLGQKVYQSGLIENQKQFVITLNEINSGVYFLKVHFKDGTIITKKIVK